MKWNGLEAKLLENIDADTCRILVCEAPNGTIVENGLYSLIVRNEDLTDEVYNAAMLAV